MSLRNSLLPSLDHPPAVPTAHAAAIVTRGRSRAVSTGVAALALAALLASLSLTTGCLFFFGKKKPAPAAANSSLAPDKVLYDRGMADIKRGKYTEGRLTLQTLINTYPDSEYLAKAKLVIADSFYKEGGTSGLTQAIAEYQDFVTFFPFLDEAAYAQMQVAMAHYRMMEKPDRDRTQALQAEDAFQTMIVKYPQSKWTPEATQHLREVQEVLAEGDYAVARFYDIRTAYKAAAARLLELTARYPLFSQADRANWMLGEIYQKAERNDLAAQFYARIVREYPLSSLAPDAKKRLQQLGNPVPQPDPAALARMQAEQAYERAHPAKGSLVHRTIGAPLSILHTSPSVARAAHVGDPDLQPQSVEVSATDVLQPATGAGMTAGASGNGTGTGATTNAVAVERVGAPAAGAADASSTEAAAGGNNAGETGATAPAESPKELAQGVQPDKKGKKQKDSTSKKKKGWHKIIPW